MKIDLPFWMKEKASALLTKAMERWFDWVKEVAGKPAALFDVDTSPIEIVNLIADSRDVKRFPNEQEWLYRLRVKHAYANARDAGSSVGFRQIWQRMGLGQLDITERIEGRDWDVIELLVDEKTIADNPELLSILVEKYGRTCRRYEWTTMSIQMLHIIGAMWEEQTTNLLAVLYDTNTTHRNTESLYSGSFDHSAETVRASWLEYTKTEQNERFNLKTPTRNVEHITENLTAVGT